MVLNVPAQAIAETPGRMSRAFPRRAGDFAGMRIVKRFVPVLAVVLAAAGCTSKNLSASVVAFDTSVGKAVERYNEQLDRVVELHTAEVRDALADENAKLVTTGCDVLLIEYSPALASDCVVVKVENGAPAPVDANPVRVANLKALAAALADYSGALTLLVADPGEDRAAFRDALANLATTIGDLQGQAERAGGKVLVDRESLTAISGLFAEAGGLYFERRRSETLREAIEAAHPFVVGATEVLGQSSREASTALLARTVAQDLNEAEREMVRVANAAPSRGAVKSAQDRVFEAHREYLDAASTLSSFASVREAHEAMLNAARSGLAAEDLIVLAEKLTILASRVDETIETIDRE